MADGFDWFDFYDACRSGRLADYLVRLPHTHWNKTGAADLSLLHYACQGPNVGAAVALLQSGLVDMNARNKWGTTPAHWAAVYSQSHVLEVLCAAGADLRACDEDGLDPIDHALVYTEQDEGATVRVLVANGVRLSTVREDYRYHITPDFVAFERGVLRCRAAVVAMLRVKKAAELHHVDKFLMRELAYAMWATRTCAQWQK